MDSRSQSLRFRFRPVKYLSWIFTYMCNRASERAVWENLADFSSPPRERKEGSVIRGSVARFFPNGKSNLWLGNKLDFLRIEITQQACISRLIGGLQISFVIKWEDCYCCWKGYKEGGGASTPPFSGLQWFTPRSFPFSAIPLLPAPSTPLSRSFLNALRDSGFFSN